MRMGVADVTLPLCATSKGNSPGTGGFGGPGTGAALLPGGLVMIGTCLV